MNERPILGITMGDPAGIGPEIAVKSLLRSQTYRKCRPLIIGDAGVVAYTAERILEARCRINAVDAPDKARFEPGVLDVLDLGCVDIGKFKVGEVSPMCGDAAFKSVAKAIELAMAGHIHGTVTGPLNKEAMNKAGHHYNGHTEIYADLTGTRDYAMLLAGENLRVVHVTTHVAVAGVSERVTKDRVLKVIRLGNDAVKKFGVDTPRIAVSGLNPHAGENGLFGSEEGERIVPAIREAEAEGIIVSGPHPPDTVFCKAAGGAFDLVVAMYHDQGHIPMKLLSFKYDARTDTWSDMTGVNITLGLPIVRTSVDHGTAFEQAGRGQANPNSLIYAIDCGAMLSR